LPVHEVENFFLHPATLCILLQQNGHAELVSGDLIREASDERAGSWIFQHTMATPNAKSLPEITPPAIERAKSLSWTAIDADRNSAIESIVRLADFEPDVASKFQGILNISINAYERKRTEGSLWKVCEGKQVLNQIARAAGYAGAPALVSATFAAWERDGTQLPEELATFRSYLTTL
jgi:hypothetical protein